VEKPSSFLWGGEKKSLSYNHHRRQKRVKGRWPGRTSRKKRSGFSRQGERKKKLSFKQERGGSFFIEGNDGVSP